MPKVKREWKQFSFRSAADGIDCGDKECYLEYRVIPDCNVILETNNSNCKIPCLLDGCDTELHHFIACPLWNCVPNVPTTTVATSTVTSTSTTPIPTPQPNPPNSNKMSALIYTSIVLNILFFAIVCAYIVVKCRIWISNRQPIRLPSMLDLNPNRFFSIGDSDNDSDSNHERDPLLENQPLALAVGEAQTPALAETPAIRAINNESLVGASNQMAILESNPSILGIENVAFDHSAQPVASTSNWQEVNLDSIQSPISQAAASSLNETKTEKKDTSSIFLFMKKISKK